jgi:hypothetical protein
MIKTNTNESKMRRFFFCIKYVWWKLIFLLEGGKICLITVKAKLYLLRTA